MLIKFNFGYDFAKLFYLKLSKLTKKVSKKLSLLLQVSSFQPESKWYQLKPTFISWLCKNDEWESILKRQNHDLTLEFSINSTSISFKLHFFKKCLLKYLIILHLNYKLNWALMSSLFISLLVISEIKDWSDDSSNSSINISFY